MSKTTRKLTDEERTHANVVFQGKVKLDEVKVVIGGWQAFGGYARTVGHTIYFPHDPEMHWMMHELGHVWQAETVGYSYMAKALFAQVSGGYDYGGAKKLAKVREGSGTIKSFNVEQQAEIIADFWKRLTEGDDIAAWAPYIEDVRGG